MKFLHWIESKPHLSPCLVERHEMLSGKLGADACGMCNNCGNLFPERIDPRLPKFRYFAFLADNQSQQRNTCRDEASNNRTYDLFW